MKDKVQIGKYSRIIMPKLMLLLLCICFVKGYTYMFTEENSMAAIVLIVIGLIFSQKDLGYHVKESSLSLLLLIFIITFGSKISLLNPYLGIVINFISIGTILILAGHVNEKECNICLIMCYLFCQGYEVSGKVLNLRIISLILGGIIISLIYYFVHKNKKYTENTKTVIKDFKADKEKVNWFWRMTISLTTVLFIGDLMNIPRTMWIALTVLSLTRLDVSQIKERTKHRIIGATVGIIVFIVVATIVDYNTLTTIVVVFTGFMIMFVETYKVKSGINGFLAITTSLVFFSPQVSIFLRIVTNLAGILLVAIVTFTSFKIFRSYNEDEFSELESA